MNGVRFRKILRNYWKKNTDWLKLPPVDFAGENARSFIRHVFSKSYTVLSSAKIESVLVFAVLLSGNLYLPSISLQCPLICFQILTKLLSPENQWYFNELLCLQRHITWFSYNSVVRTKSLNPWNRYQQGQAQSTFWLLAPLNYGVCAIVFCISTCFSFSFLRFPLGWNCGEEQQSFRGSCACDRLLRDLSIYAIRGC